MMNGKHDYYLLARIVVVLVVLLCLVSSIPATNSIVWRPSSSWKKKPTLINRLSSSSLIQVDEVLRGGGGGGDVVPPIVEDDVDNEEEVDERAVAIPSQVSPLAFIKHFSVWYYNACQRAITTAVAEFKRPVTSGAGQSNLLVCCLVRTKRMVVGSTVAFWKTENRSQVGGEAKQVASQLLSWSTGKLKKVREIRREALSSEESGEDDEDDSVMEKGVDAMSMEEEVRVAPFETTTSNNESEEPGIMPSNFNGSPTTTGRSSSEEASTSSEVQSTTAATTTTTTTSTVDLPPKKNIKSKVVRIAAIVNKISSYCIVIVFLGIAVREFTTDGGVDISKLLSTGKTIINDVGTKIKTFLSWIQSKIMTGGEKPKQK